MEGLLMYALQWQIRNGQGDRGGDGFKIRRKEKKHVNEASRWGKKTKSSRGNWLGEAQGLCKFSYSSDPHGDGTTVQQGHIRRGK